MKTSSMLIFLVLAGLAFFFGWQSQLAAPISTVSAQAPTSSEIDCDKNRALEVSGTAVVYVTPDRAMIQLGVQSNGVTPDAVNEENMKAIQKVISAIKTLGIESKYISTDHFIIYPVYSEYSSLTIKGYRIDNTVSVTLTNAALSDDVILTALKNGANEIRDVQFYTSELRKFRDQARELAMKAAGEKAAALASSANARTGCLLSARENIVSQYYGSRWGGRDMGLWTQNVIQNNTASSGTVQTLGDGSPVSLGQIAVQAEISASYSLK